MLFRIFAVYIKLGCIEDPMPAFISIGADLGDRDSFHLSELKIAMCRSLETHMTGTHCDAVDEYALVIRVDGSFAKFGDEGLACLRFSRVRRCISVDIQVPEVAWKPLDRAQTKLYLAKQLKAAIGACVGRLLKDKCEVEALRLEHELDLAMQEFLGSQNAA